MFGYGKSKTTPTVTNLPTYKSRNLSSTPCTSTSPVFSGRQHHSLWWQNSQCTSGTFSKVSHNITPKPPFHLAGCQRCTRETTIRRIKPKPDTNTPEVLDSNSSPVHQENTSQMCNVSKGFGTPFDAPDPPPLPFYRMTDSHPFTVTGVDFTGAI
jgi:hypothetical protein